MEQYMNSVWLFFAFWLGYRVYDLKSDLNTIRSYMGKTEKSEEELSFWDVTFRDQFHMVLNGPLPSLVMAVLSFFIIAIMGLLAAIDTIGIFIMLKILELPSYVHIFLVLIAALSLIDALLMSYSMSRIFYIGFNHPHRKMKAIAGYVHMQTVDSLPSYVEAGVHLVSLGAAIYLVSQLI